MDSMWAVVEVFGHQRFAGRVSEETLAGQGFVRVDVPECGERSPGFSKLFGPGAIFGITPTTEAIARRCAQDWRSQALDAYTHHRLELEDQWGGAPDRIALDDGEE